MGRAVRGAAVEVRRGIEGLEGLEGLEIVDYDEFSYAEGWREERRRR